ncbi:MAG: carbonic anhydrase [Cytophagales bacterium]|nr:carbonic anhydrase [Cytophagales bacterium]
MSNHILKGVMIALICVNAFIAWGQDSHTHENKKNRTMNDLAILKERNETYVRTYQAGIPMNPKFNTVILTCIDARIVPAHFLGLELGDAIVMRNPGARVTDEVERDLAILWTLASKIAGDQFDGLSFMIIHHTDCGYEKLANPKIQEGLSAQLGIDKETLDALAIHDHTSAMKDDISKLKNSERISPELEIYGLLYDVETGMLNEL